MTETIKVFDYIEEIDAFTVTREFQNLSDHAAVWIGRLFLMDNDVGEHWFDNWDKREAIAEDIRDWDWKSAKYSQSCRNALRMAAMVPVTPPTCGSTSGRMFSNRYS